MDGSKLNQIAPPVSGTPEEMEAWNNMMSTMVTFINASTLLINTINSRNKPGVNTGLRPSLQPVKSKSGCEPECEACLSPPPPPAPCGICTTSPSQGGGGAPDTGGDGGKNVAGDEKPDAADGGQNDGSEGNTEDTIPEESHDVTEGVDAKSAENKQVPKPEFPEAAEVSNQDALKYSWVENSEISDTYFPSTAVCAGFNKENNAIYVGSASVGGLWSPAYIVPAKNEAYICGDSSESPVTEYKILCEQRFDWVTASNGNVPKHAVVGGQTSENENLYVGRLQHEGEMRVGRVQPSQKACYIPYNGEELSFPNYEVLVRRS